MKNDNNNNNSWLGIHTTEKRRYQAEDRCDVPKAPRFRPYLFCFGSLQVHPTPQHPPSPLRHLIMRITSRFSILAKSLFQSGILNQALPNVALVFYFYLFDIKVPATPYALQNTSLSWCRQLLEQHQHNKHTMFRKGTTHDIERDTEIGQSNGLSMNSSDIVQYRCIIVVMFVFCLGMLVGFECIQIRLLSAELKTNRMIRNIAKKALWWKLRLEHILVKVPIFGIQSIRAFEMTVVQGDVHNGASQGGSNE